MGLYFGNNKITGVHFGTVGAGGTTITISAPTLSLNSNTGVVTATVTQSSSGYLTAGSASNTLSLTTQAAATITPTKSTQTAVTAGKYTLGAVTVAAIPSNYIIPSGTLDITTNGTHTVTNYASVSVNVPTGGATPTLQTKTATPTESTQTITADSGYDGLDSVEIEAISSTYVGSGVTRKAATTIHPATYLQTAAAANVYTTGVITVAAVPFTEIEYQGVHQDENGYLWPGIATNILRNSRNPMTYYGNDGAWDSGSWSVRSGGNGTGAACSGINANLDGVAILNNTSGNRDVYQRSFPYTPNATYTASFYAKMDDSCTKTSITAQLRIWNDTTGKNHSGTTKTISSKTDWTLISLTFVAPASGILVFQAGISGAGAIDMSAFQLKSGVGVTEWAPSSYDFTLNSSGIDTLNINNASFDYVSGFKAKNSNNNILTYIRPSGTYPITTNGTYNITTYENVSVNIPTGSTINNQNKTVNPTESQQQITADSGYTGLGTVTVNAMPSGSATTPATTITANPTLSTTFTSGSGYKMSVSATESITPTVSAGYVSSGTAGTITVSGSAYVTQSAITNNTTLPSGSTSSGTVNAGSYLKIGAGYYPTDRYYMAQAQTNGSVGTPVATKGTVSNHSISITPSVSYTAGYIAGGSKTGTAVTVSASELVSGSETKTENGTYDVTNLASVVVNVSGGGGDVSALAKRTWPSGEVTLDADVTEIGEFLFARTPITRISGQNVTTIRTGAFKQCTELTQITKDDFPNVTTIAADSAAEATFYGCSKLQLIHFPNLVTIPTTQWPSGSGKIGSSGIEPILVLPKITTFPNFRSYITTFAAIDLGPNITTTTISGTSYFYEGYVRVLIIRKSDAIIAAGNANAIRRLSSSTTMYVPQALVSSYQTASNWSTKYAAGMQILAIEGSQYENYYADGTPISTT